MEILKSSIRIPEWAGRVTCSASHCGAELGISLDDLTIKRKNWLSRFFSGDGTGGDEFGGYNGPEEDFSLYFTCPECEYRQKAYINHRIGYPILFWAWTNRGGNNANQD